MKKRSVLVIGGGGREHAIVKALRTSDADLDILVYPANTGAERDGARRVKGSFATWDDLAAWAATESIDLAVAGPEQPLVEGVQDSFSRAGVPLFGPSGAAARLEGSKEFSKELMRKYNIPTARWESFTDYDSARAYVEQEGAPIVIKVSGLAAGKGAIVCQTMDEAKAALDEIFREKRFGAAGNTVVIEEMMYGPEASVFAITDGEEYRVLPVSQDHKRIFDGDQGPNTGGMGAYAPAPVVDDALLQRVETEIIQPTLAAMKAEGTPYRGLLYTGIMITAEGPKVVEYNCRFGDPETEAVLPLVDCDWFELLRRSAVGGVRKVDFNLRSAWGTTVVLASAGYPAGSDKGRVITGIDAAEETDGVHVCFAGAALQGANYVTSGGRVLAVTAISEESLEDSVKKAYDGVDKIDFEGMQFRRDIAAKAL
ncbi:MAG: phosphoribosylamine--glycine ligase [Fibrobacterota bacterium]